MSLLGEVILKAPGMIHDSCYLWITEEKGEGLASEFKLQAIVHTYMCALEEKK